MLTHRNKKPYECKTTGCGKSYCDARSLRRHTENHHTGTGVAAAAEPDASAGTTVAAAAVVMETADRSALTSGSSSGRSPATASGDASSPHGATTTPNAGGGSSFSDTDSTAATIQYIKVEPLDRQSTNGSSASPSVSTAMTVLEQQPKSSVTISAVTATNGNESLSQQQLDLISQIMQQTKESNATALAERLNNSQAQQQQQQQFTQLSQRPRTWNMQVSPHSQ